MRLFLEHPSVDRSATFSVAISTMSKEECPPGVHRWPPPSQSRHVLQEQGSPTGPPPLRRHRRRLHPALSRPFQRPPLPLLLRGCNRPRARHQDLPSYEPQRRQGRLAFDLVKQMSSTEIPLKLRSFGPTLFEFYKKGEVGKAREVSESMAEIIESWIVTEAAEEVGLEKGAVWKVEEGMVKGRWMRLVCAGVAFKAVFPDRSRPREFFPGETRCVEGGGNMNEISVCRCCSRDRLPRERGQDLESWYGIEAVKEVGLEKRDVWKVEGRWMRLVCAGVALEAIFPERSRPREFVSYRGCKGGWIEETRCVEGGGRDGEGKMDETVDPCNLKYHSSLLAFRANADKLLENIMSGPFQQFSQSCGCLKQASRADSSTNNVYLFAGATRRLISGRISHIIQLYVADQWSGSTRQQRGWWWKCKRLAWLWAISSHKKGQEKSTSLLISLMPDANQGRAGVCGVKAMGSGRGHA
ncbi:hypothetical protein OPV22_029900 [Ensete ventricosum]|uniref:PROP1-like PPR domain-containing protein n=1 Tax=Ensete ventricosum TaxID=4639 RepID=A0AAV8Q2L3_ENSVE|nr:hypothetical protein OPV22_029900 [Ensete ventricosum]